MQQKTERTDEKNVSDVDELQRKAEQLTDDGMFHVRIKNWEKIGSKSVEVIFEKPDGDEQKQIMEWPDKPTKENKFIKICMDALDLQNAQDAAMMSENLKNCELDDYRVKADVDNGEWEIKPEIDLGIKYRLKSRVDREHKGTDRESIDAELWKKLSCLTLGPIALLYLSIIGTFFEPKIWFQKDKSSEESYWVIVCVLYSVVGTVFWLSLLFYSMYPILLI